MRGARERDSGVVTREALDHEPLRKRVGATTAVFLRERDAEKTKLAQLFDDVTWEGIFLVPLGRVRFNFVFGEFRERTADLTLLVAQFEVHRISADSCSRYSRG